MVSNKDFVIKMEKRFKQIAKIDIDLDLSIYPLSNRISNIQTNKDKSKEFSEVFTPLWLVDRMIAQVRFKSSNKRTLDLCAGYGQFSIRLLRYYLNRHADFNVREFIKNNHAFSELQLSSCYKLLNIFGNQITLFIGDSSHLTKLPRDARGIWIYVESYGYWVCLTETIKQILSPNGNKSKPISENKFVSSIELLTRELNTMHSVMKEKYTLTAKQLTPKMRLVIIDHLNAMVKDDKGHPVVKVIPTNLVSDMCSCINDLEKKSILVLYNCEILEHLIHRRGINPSQITFAADFKASCKSDIMKKMYGVDTITISDDPTSMHAEFNGRQFDVCLSNPPYNRGLDLKILQALMADGTIAKSIAKEYVWVHPAKHFIDRKGNPLCTNARHALRGKLKSAYLFNGNPIFDIKLFIPCVISHIDIEFNSNIITVSLFNEKFCVNSVDDITKFGSQWKTIVEPLFYKIKTFIEKSGQVWSHNEKTIDDEKIYCQLASIRGHVNLNKKNNILASDDFYSMTMKNVSENKGVRQPRLDKPGNPIPTFGFTTSQERDNFISYLNTDFARFCLALLKNNSDLSVGNMEMIPWLDFTQAWDDEKLFNHFDINKKTQDYIRKFLPDYYGIRK